MPPDNSPYTSARPAPNPSLLQVCVPPPLLLPALRRGCFCCCGHRWRHPCWGCCLARCCVARGAAPASPIRPLTDSSLRCHVPCLQLQEEWGGMYAEVIAQHAQQQEALAQHKAAAAAAKQHAAAVAAAQQAAGAAVPCSSMLTAAMHGLPAHLQHAGQPRMMSLGLMQQLMSMQAQQQHMMSLQQ